MKAAWTLALEVLFRIAPPIALVLLAFCTALIVYVTGDALKALSFGVGGMLGMISYMFVTSLMSDAFQGLEQVMRRWFPQRFVPGRRPRNTEFIDTSVRTKPKSMTKPDA